MLNIYWGCFSTLMFIFALVGGWRFPLQKPSFFCKTFGRGCALGTGGETAPSSSRLLSGARWMVTVALAAPQSLAELAAPCCLHMSSRPLRKQGQLTSLPLLAGEYGTFAPKLGSRHRTWGELGWKGPWSDPSLKARPASEWDQVQDLAQSSCEFLLMMEILLILWASGPALDHPHGLKKK